MVSELNYFWPMIPFYTPLKKKENFDFLVFSGIIKWKHLPEQVRVIYMVINYFMYSILFSARLAVLHFRIQFFLCGSLLTNSEIFFHLILKLVSYIYIYFTKRKLLEDMKKWFLFTQKSFFVLDIFQFLYFPIPPFSPCRPLLNI